MTTATISKTQNADSSALANMLGEKGVKAAARFLERQGFEILERDWECAHGEVDLIVRDEDALVFAEAKTRSNRDTGLPEEAVSNERRARYEKVAISYLSAHDFTDIAVCFDVVSILVVSEDRAFLRHHINAFSSGE